MVYLIYILTILVGLYAFLTNFSALIVIGFPDNQLKLSKFMVSLFPTLIGLFMIYFGTTSLISLIKKKNKS